MLPDVHRHHGRKINVLPPARQRVKLFCSATSPQPHSNLHAWHISEYVTLWQPEDSCSDDTHTHLSATKPQPRTNTHTPHTANASHASDFLVASGFIATIHTHTHDPIPTQSRTLLHYPGTRLYESQRKVPSMELTWCRKARYHSRLNLCHLIRPESPFRSFKFGVLIAWMALSWPFFFSPMMADRHFLRNPISLIWGRPSKRQVVALVSLIDWATFAVVSVY